MRRDEIGCQSVYNYLQTVKDKGFWIACSCQKKDSFCSRIYLLKTPVKSSHGWMMGLGRADFSSIGKADMSIFKNRNGGSDTWIR